MEYTQNTIHIDQHKFRISKGKTSFPKAAKLANVGEGTLFRAYYKQDKLSVKNARKIKEAFGDVLFIKAKKTII